MNYLFGIIGPSGAGKSTLLKMLYEKHNIIELISHTTREPRKDERNGVHYYFTDKDNFKNIDFVEHSEYNNNFYGISKQEVFNKLKDGNCTIAIDLNGARQLKKLLHNQFISIFIMAEPETLLKRMLSRGDSWEKAKNRIQYASFTNEFDIWKHADFIISNTNDINNAFYQLNTIINGIIFNKWV